MFLAKNKTINGNKQAEKIDNTVLIVTSKLKKLDQRLFLGTRQIISLI
jgi:hypothetical protein